jgi:pumilio family protein 6
MTVAPCRLKHAALPDKVVKKQERNAKRQKNQTLIQEIAVHWEVLRQGNTPKDKKKELVGKILDACGDRVGDVAASHTASRIIQSCVKYGDAGQRLRVQRAVLGSGRGAVELAKNPYSRFVVSKLIMTAPKDQLGGTWMVLCIVLCCVLYCVVFVR